MKRILNCIIVLCLFLFPLCLNAAPDQDVSLPYFEKVLVGNVKENASILQINEKKIMLYECFGALYIPRCVLEGKECPLRIDGENAYVNPMPLYIGNLQTYSLLVQEEVLIPMEALEMLWDIQKEGWYYRADAKKENFNQYITITASAIYNHSSYPIYLTYKDLYWNGKQVIEIDHKQKLIGAREVLSRRMQEDKGIYLTTFCTEMNEWKIEDSQKGYGQKNIPLFKKYTDTITLRKLEKLFLPYKVKGKMKYAVGSFKVGEEVEVWRAEKRSYYTVISKHAKKINIPWESIEIPTDSWVVLPCVNKEQIETYANLKGFESSTEYLVWTDIHRQKTYILKGEKEKWKVEKIMLCSSGENKYLTPTGIYKTYYRIPYFGLEKGFRCKNAVVIFRDYMYHSILFDKSGLYPKQSLYQLGQRRSHGCIRLSEEDSAWIYKNIPLESTVWIN